MALTLPAVEEVWLEGFARGFLALADFYNVELVGGDMTRGPLSITVTIQGLVPEQGVLRRSGAQPGDALFVTGTLGDGALALQQLLGKAQVASPWWPALRDRLEQPEPRILAGSRPGDIVLDPFMGSGTTAAVALQHGRQYLGCELNPEYGPLQDERIAKATPPQDSQMALLDDAA